MIRVMGASPSRIIFKHMLSSFSSYLIVSLTMSIPATILGETALSFLGLGMQSPAVSWGMLLVSDLISISKRPWMLIPSLAVIFTVLCFNFLGDGLRDAADPFEGKAA